MNFDLKAWSETNGFVWCPYTRRDGKPDGDLVCQQGLITGADDGSSLVAIVSDADDGELSDIEALARVRVKRLTLDKDTYAFWFDPAHVGNVAALLQPCREPVDEIPWRAVVSRLAWRQRGKKAQRDASLGNY